MKTWLFLLTLLLGVSSFAQNQIVLTFTMPMPKDFEKNCHLLDGCDFGQTAIVNADTTKWTCPKNIRESVIYFSDKEMSEAQKKLKEHLLGFFYNENVIGYEKGGFFHLNTKSSLYKKNNIDLRYRKFVKEFYDKANAKIKRLRAENNFPEEFLMEQFKLNQDSHAREIIQ